MTVNSDLNWTYKFLDCGKILVRGEIDADDPMTCELILAYRTVSLSMGYGQDMIVVARYTCRSKKGPSLEFNIGRSCTPSAQTGRGTWVFWQSIYPNLLGSKTHDFPAQQVGVVVSSEFEVCRSIGIDDARLSLHVGACLALLRAHRSPTDGYNSLTMYNRLSWLVQA